MSTTPWLPPVERWEELGEALGVELLIARDDLLPFPLPGNKVRKLYAELEGADPDAILLTNGAVTSNHCRTLAMIGARRGQEVHLVLHGDSAERDGAGLRMLSSLGAKYEIVEPESIARELDKVEISSRAQGRAVTRIAGGCHTPAGAKSFRDAGLTIMDRWAPDVIVVASGTGATQGGLAAAAEGRPRTRVVGVSVAREARRGAEAVAEAAAWAGSPNAEIEFLDGYRDGGYGKWTRKTEIAVSQGWMAGLPLDHTYTGKAFAALTDAAGLGGSLRGSRVLFWHTGGLMNFLTGEGASS